jgi:hypothetical protein
MHIPNNFTWSTDFTFEPQHELAELLDNPITYEIILMISVLEYSRPSVLLIGNIFIPVKTNIYRGPLAHLHRARIV